MQGFTYETIAAKIGIANRGTVHRMVHQAIRERAARGVEELRRVSYDRLEALILTLWPEVERGDIKAIAAALRVITAEIRLFQLDDVAKRTTGGPKTVVQPDLATTATGRQVRNVAPRDSCRKAWRGSAQSCSRAKDTEPPASCRVEP